jgi:hypothetical protein
MSTKKKKIVADPEICTKFEPDYRTAVEATPMYVYNVKDMPAPAPHIVTPEEEIQRQYGSLGNNNVTGLLRAILTELVRARLERG